MSNVMTKQMLAMLKLQNQFQTAVYGKDWYLLGNNYIRFANVELGEAIGHLAYKPWKKETSNFFQCQFELIDIVHFMLSEQLVNSYRGMGTDEARLEALKFTAGTITESHMVALDRVPHLIDLTSETNEGPNLTLVLERMDELFVQMNSGSLYSMMTQLLVCLRTLGVGTQDLFRMYIAKNALCTFRNLNGYKQGTYIKEFDGKEDNVALEELMDNFEGEPEELFDAMLEGMDAYYKKNIALEYAVAQ